MEELPYIFDRYYKGDAAAGKAAGAAWAWQYQRKLSSTITAGFGLKVF